MVRAVFLDSGPLGLATQRRGKSVEVDDCKRWIASLSLANVSIYVPEVVDYEVRRELLRANKTVGIARLAAIKTTAIYLPITSDAMLLAADLWAQSRRSGIPTADVKALDVDVILAAQVLSTGLPTSEIVVATSNVDHISRFLAADIWQNIHPSASNLY